MSDIIKKLDSVTANQIAAGEVVERPASVIKELLENSIDAGSTKIDVFLVDGGLQSMRVVDNGWGMSPKDAILAFERHATSKINLIDDLLTLNSLGFRGEALPSIASVSKLSLTTRQAHAIAAITVQIEGGHVVAQGESGAPVGTTIEVTDLFYNTPARLKHLKSVATEGGQVTNIVSRLALSYPHIAFTVKNNGRIVMQTTGNGELLAAIASIYGNDTARKMWPLAVNTDFAKLQGFLGSPELNRTSRQSQSLFVNQRYVRSRIVSEAVEAAFADLTMVGRYPMFVLNLTLSPHRLDVNVHPTKMEVRFEQEEELAQLITTEIRKVLTTQTKPVNLVEAPVLRQEEPKPDEAPAPPATQTHIPFIPPAKVLESPRPYLLESQPAPKQEPQAKPELVVAASTTSIRHDWLLELIPIGQIDQSYIVAQGHNGLYLIDQHAAHERILYEQFNSAMSEQQSQALLLPETIDLTHQEKTVVIENIIFFTDLGFIMEYSGENTFVLRAIPQGLGLDNPRQLLLDFVDYYLENHRNLNPQQLRQGMITLQACKAAIKSNQYLSLPSMHKLLETLATTENCLTCPHGRPTVLNISRHELAKRFGRIQ